MLTVLVLLLAFDTFSTVKNERENRHRANENRALVERNRELAERTLRLAERNCRNSGKLAAIERAFIARTEGQSEALLKSGVTFGIPPDQLSALIKASQDSQARFLGGLDALKIESCSARALGVQIVKPRKKKGAAKGHAHTTGIGGTLAPPSTTAPGRQAPSKATSPRARANPLPTRRRAPTRSAVAPTQGAGGGASTTAPVSTASSPPPTGPAPPPTLPPPGKSPVTIRLPCVETPVVSVC